MIRNGLCDLHVPIPAMVGSLSYSAASVASFAPSASATPPAAATPAATSQGFNFHELLSELNPLQYIPVIGTLYRSVTGDTIPQAALTVGSLVFSGLAGGPVGLAIGAASVGLEQATGINPETIGHNLLADIGIGTEESNGRHARRDGDRRNAHERLFGHRHQRQHILRCRRYNACDRQPPQSGRLDRRAALRVRHHQRARRHAAAGAPGRQRRAEPTRARRHRPTGDGGRFRHSHRRQRLTIIARVRRPVSADHPPCGSRHPTNPDPAGFGDRDACWDTRVCPHDPKATENAGRRESSPNTARRVLPPDAAGWCRS